MRFDKVIDLIIIDIFEDGLGGREQGYKVYKTLNANIEELSEMETYKVYGEATTDSIRARVLGKITENIKRVGYDNKLYKVVSKRYVKNKTVFLLEVIEDD